MTYRSDEEIYFAYWLDELKERGLIIDYYYEAVTHTLLDKVVQEVCEMKVVKNKCKFINTEKVIMKEVKYTVDFIIEWNPEAENIIYNLINNENCQSCQYDNLGNVLAVFVKTPLIAHCLNIGGTIKHVSYVDVKGSFTGLHNNSAITFPIKQKLMWDKHSIYVNKVIPNSGSNCLFQESFYPVNYLVDPVTKNVRKKRLNGKFVPLNSVITCVKVDDFIEENEKCLTQKMSLLHQK